MAGVSGQHGQEGGLCSAIALPEEMDRVELSQQMRRSRRKAVGVPTSQPVALTESVEQLGQFPFEVLRIGEGTAVLKDADGAGLAGPVVDVLEKMPMNGPKMVGVERSIRESFFRSLRDRRRFKGIELPGICQSRSVAQNLATLG